MIAATKESPKLSFSAFSVLGARRIFRNSPALIEEALRRRAEIGMSTITASQVSVRPKVSPKPGITVGSGKRGKALP
jgi:hypothetical protein